MFKAAQTVHLATSPCVFTSCGGAASPRKFKRVGGGDHVIMENGGGGRQSAEVDLANSLVSVSSDPG